jgi:flagellar biosynthesis/type III secretory pathway protein FliH
MTGAQATKREDGATEPTADLHALLDVARSSFFEEDNSSIGAKSFEKADSLFSLVQSTADNAEMEESENPEASGVIDEDEKSTVNTATPEIDTEPVEFISNSAGSDGNNGDWKPEEDVGSQHLEVEQEPATSTSSDFQKETFDQVENVVEEDLPEAQSAYNSEQLEAEYKRGFEDAVSKLQSSIDAEKKELSDVLKLAIITGEELGSIAEQLIKAKLNEVSQIFMGKVIDETPDYLIKFIEKTCRELSDAQDNIKLTLSEDDAKVLRSLEVFGNTSTQIDCDPNFERGHFKIQMGHSYIEKHFDLS